MKRSYSNFVKMIKMHFSDFNLSIIACSFIFTITTSSRESPDLRDRLPEERDVGEKRRDSGKRRGKRDEENERKKQLPHSLFASRRIDCSGPFAFLYRGAHRKIT